MMKRADTYSPNGRGGPNDIGEAELGSLLIGRRIVGVSFQKDVADLNRQGALLLILDDKTTVSVSGQGHEIQCVDVVVETTP